MNVFQDFKMQIQDVFRFADGRSVFLGVVEGNPGYIRHGPVALWRDGERKSEWFLIEGEMLSDRTNASGESSFRSVSTTGPFCLDRATLSKGNWVLKASSLANVRRTMHRHLLGLNDPPKDYVADPMTQGPALPEDWDGDAWVAPKENGYFLRAWNARSGRVAYGEGTTYADARSALMSDVADGDTRVSITTVTAGSA